MVVAAGGVPAGADVGAVVGASVDGPECEESLEGGATSTTTTIEVSAPALIWS